MSPIASARKQAKNIAVTVGLKGIKMRLERSAPRNNGSPPPRGIGVL